MSSTDPTATLESAPKKQKTGAPPPKPACLGCRKIKVKCLDGPNGRCTRCERLNFACEYSSAKRGRKVKNPSFNNGTEKPDVNMFDFPGTLAESSEMAAKRQSMDSTSPSQATLAPAQSAYPQHRSPSSSSNTRSEMTPYQSGLASYPNIDEEMASQHFSGDSSTGPFDIPLNDAQQPYDNFNNYGMDLGIYPNNSYSGEGFLAGNSGFGMTDDMITGMGDIDALIASLPAEASPSQFNLDYMMGVTGPGGMASLTEQSRILDGSSALSPFEGRAVLPASFDAGDACGGAEDPVLLGLVDKMTAARLYAYFMGSCNLLFGTLDPALHTINYVQNSSSFLFTSILAVSARFTGAPQHPSLHAHAKRLLGIALTEGTCDVPTIQAVTIFVFWKPPEDNNMWLRLGHAIRLAYELDMHKPRQTLLPADEFEARQVLDKERLWFCIRTYDHMYSRLNAKPAFTKSAEFMDANDWIQDRPDWHCSSDWQRVYVEDYMHIAIDIKRLDELATPGPYVNSQLDQLENGMEKLWDKWCSGRGFEMLKTGRRLPVWHYDLMHVLSSIRLRIQPTQHNRLQVLRYGGLFLETIKAWHEMDMLPRMHDIQCEVYKRCAESLVKLHPHIPRRDQESLSRLIDSSFMILDGATQKPGGAAIVHVRDAFRKMLVQILTSPESP